MNTTMKYWIKLILLLIPATGLLSEVAFTQVGIGITNPDPKAVLHVQSTTKGMLIPRLTSEERSAFLVSSVPSGLIIFCTNCRQNGALQLRKSGGWMDLYSMPASAPGQPANRVPSASGVQQNGNAYVGQVLTGSYSYFDWDGDPEGASGYEWTRYDDIDGTTGELVVGTDLTYTIQSGDVGKYLRFAVAPEALAGASPGNLVSASTRVGPVGNSGCEITDNYGNCYYKVKDPASGRIWLDRNLGSTRVARAGTDYQAFGSLFQFGRPADGHELMTYASNSSGTPVNGSTDVLSSTPVPGHNMFITSTSAPYNWMSTYEINLWDETSGYENNPCPSQYAVPTLSVMREFILSLDEQNHMALSNSFLHLPIQGFRSATGVLYYFPGAQYWVTEFRDSEQKNGLLYIRSTGSLGFELLYRGYGAAVRCVEK